MALHEQSIGATDEWYTPAYIFEAMATRFDLDVAAAGSTPSSAWCLRECYQGGLELPWRGSVWMNAPFGGRNGLVPWLEKFAEHGNGVCLVPDRTSAPWWQWAARRVDMCLFVSPKVKFLGVSGQEGRSPAQGTCLMAQGSRGMGALVNAQDNGLGFLMRPVELFKGL